MHTSKACNIISKYTAYVPVDVSQRLYLPTVVAYPSSGKAGGWPGSPPGTGGGVWDLKGQSCRVGCTEGPRGIKTPKADGVATTGHRSL